MNEATSIVLPQTQALEVDSSVIDTSEVSTQEDKDFLVERGTQILRVVAKAALLVGQQLVAIQDRFKNKQTGELTKFYVSVGISLKQASHWSNKYRAYCAYVEIFGENESFEKLSPNTASKIWNLPAETRKAFLNDISNGEIPTREQVAEVAKRPDVQLSKAEELLAAAKERQVSAGKHWEAVKADPEIPSTLEDGAKNPEYRSAQRNFENTSTSIANFEQQIADLQAEIEAEKLKTAEEAEEKARVETELQRLKYDDASARAERIKRVGSSLTMSVPQTLADIQKFFAEKDEYPEDVRKHLVEQATILANYIGDQL